MRILPLQKLLTLIIVLCASVLAFAQPANDDCSNPTLLVVGADAASCIPVAGDTRGTVDATLVPGPEVCSGSWFTDDVWYSFETGATTPEFGITIEVRLDPTSGTELIEQGLALYTDCDTLTMPIQCFSDEAGRRTISFPPQCLEPNATFLVRLWSAPLPTDNSGTFSICAYESTQEEGPRVVFQETFDDGLSGWVSIAETMSDNANTGEMEADDWLFSDTGCFPAPFFGGEICLTSPATACQTVGAVGIPAAFYQTDRTNDGMNAMTGTNVTASLISPSIDLSKESCVNLTWLESFRGLNGGADSNLGPTVTYSIDGGTTWINPTQSVLFNGGDVGSNYGANYIANTASLQTQRSIPLIGAEGNPDVRLRFRFDGDFYFWLIDDISIIEGTTSDLIAQDNFFARATNNPMSIHQIDSYDFLIDVANLACSDQTGVNVNVSAVNSAGQTVHNVDLAYQDIPSDSLVENVPFLQPFTPADGVDNYTISYTATSDDDSDLTNNVRTFEAEVVDELMFRKEDGIATGTLGPNTAAFFQIGDPFNWEMGNIFYATSGTSATTGMPLEFNTVSFQLANADLFANERLTITVYEISDNNFDGILELDDDTEIRTIGLGDYDVTGLETGFITVDVDAFSLDPSVTPSLELRPNTHYMAAVRSNLTLASQATLDGDALSFASSNAYDYSAAIFNARQTANNDLTRIRYAHGFAISAERRFRISPSTTGDLTTGNFPENIVPLIRLGYQEVEELATVNINDNIDISIAPNPASSNITLDLSIEEATDMEISIINLSGQTMMVRSIDNVTELRENFDVSSLSSGIYMMHINTKNGVQTKKFVVSN